MTVGVTVRSFIGQGMRMWYWKVGNDTAYSGDRWINKCSFLKYKLYIRLSLYQYHSNQYIFFYRSINLILFQMLPLEPRLRKQQVQYDSYSMFYTPWFGQMIKPYSVTGCRNRLFAVISSEIDWLLFHS